MQTVWPDFLSGDHVNIYTWPPEEGAEINTEFIIDFLNNYNNIILYKNITGGSGVKCVYLKGDTSFKPKIEKGRSFTDEDFEQKRPVAIISDEEWTNSRVLVMGDKEYYLHENEKYEVIGRFKREEGKHYIEMEYYDALCFVNMNASFGTKATPLQGEYSIDAGRDSQALLSDLKTAVNSANPDTRIEEIKKSRLDDIVWMLKMAILSSMNFLVMLVSTTILILLNISNITNYWIEGRRREIGIRMLVGGRRSAIRNMVFRDYLIIVSLGYVLGVLLAIAILNFAGKKFFFGVTIYGTAVIFGYLACLLIGMVSGFIFISVSLKQKILLQMRV